MENDNKEKNFNGGDHGCGRNGSCRLRQRRDGAGSSRGNGREDTCGNRAATTAI